MSKTTKRPEDFSRGYGLIGRRGEIERRLLWLIAMLPSIDGAIARRARVPE
jgi:hypothetical protein